MKCNCIIGFLIFELIRSLGLKKVTTIFTNSPLHFHIFFVSIFFRARVDVHRKDSVGSVEKAITIYGQPDNCSNACLAILKVMQEEARNTEKSEDIPLKILAHNNLIGRIIGKQGSTIKRIMEDTETKITVSSINEINSFNMERIITVRGEPENICRAEAEVSAKLRQAYESDLNSMAVRYDFFILICIPRNPCDLTSFWDATVLSW